MATVAPTIRDTVQVAPRDTVVPTMQPSSTGGGRALAMIAELSRHPSGQQLKPGEVLGQGGMGIVRAAEQVALGRTVAVKTLRPERRAEPNAALDLLREAWVTGSLEHPNVVPVHYLELDEEGTPTIVLKRIAGLEWSAVIDDADAVRTRFGATDLLAWNLDILLAILDALRFAHARGIVHRDLKPANVMVGDFGEVYLLDWGIACALADDGSGRLPLARNATEMAGTPCYMAPEMLGGDGRPPIGLYTDIYLAGAVLFEIIAGRPPHTGDTALAVITSIIHGRPELPADAPGELARICARALANDPAERHPTIEALRDDVRAFLSHRGSATLADKAIARLAELRALVATPQPAITEVQRENPALADEHAALVAARGDAIYKLFGACRFGFLEALAVWPGNREARDGLDTAIVMVAEDELAAGNPRAVLSVVADLADNATRTALVARAKAAIEAAKQEHAALETLRRAHDRNIGTRTRMFLVGALGLVFTVAPILGATMPFDIGFESHPGTILWSAVSLAITLVSIAWARNTMLRGTLFNRRIALTGVFLFASQIVLSVGDTLAGLSIAQTHQTMVFLWGTISWLLAITLDRWLIPAALGYTVAYLLMARFPSHGLWIIAACNFVFGINVVVRWRPATFHLTEDERALRDARDARYARRSRS